MQFIIEKNIPISGRRGTNLLTETPMMEMEVNDSFLYPTENEDVMVKLRNGIASKNQTTDKRFSYRQVKGGIRIWRTI